MGLRFAAWRSGKRSAHNQFGGSHSAKRSSQAPRRPGRALLELDLGAGTAEAEPSWGKGEAAGGEPSIPELRAAAAAAQASCLSAAPHSRGRWGHSMGSRQEVRVNEHLGGKAGGVALSRGPGCLPSSNLGLSLREICFHPVPAPPGSGELGSGAAGVRVK